MKFSIKYIYILLFLLPITHFVHAQKIAEIDFDLIKKNISDTNSVYYYEDLLDRFKIFDSTLTFTDFQYIYYGSVFQPTYSPYYPTKAEEIFYQLYQLKDYRQALIYGKQAFEQNPVNTTLIFHLSIIHLALNNKKKSLQYANLYYHLLDVILNSGDGKSAETAYVVTRIGDEYEIIAQNNLQIKRQKLVGHTDIITFYKKAQKHREEKIKILYFDVTFPIKHISNLYDNFLDENK
jgi:tetratricopeptide (TPR) repeat protein